MKYLLPLLLLASPALAQQQMPIAQQVAIEQSAGHDALSHLGDAVRQLDGQVSALRKQIETLTAENMKLKADQAQAAAPASK